MAEMMAPPTVSCWPTSLWSEIAPGLFMGGTPDRGDPDPGLPFDAVVTLYAFAPAADWLVEELRYGFYDGAMGRVDTVRVRRAADWAYERWQSGDRVLIRCQAGLNRSGLVTALVLTRSGLSPAEAIDLIRESRCTNALCNDSFERWLRGDAQFTHAATDDNDDVQMGSVK
jgi:Dual specificity phosphatase, catalytic domain